MTKGGAEGNVVTTIEPEALPGPRGLPLIGNIRDLDTSRPLDSLMNLAREYGPIYKLSTPGGLRIFATGPDLVAELCDQQRFDKKVTGGLSGLRRGKTSNGLFTSDTDDPLWKRAHNILMTPFSQQAMRDYMPMMLDIAEQLMDKWERINPDEDVDVPADMTRLTLDTIALCGFGYRFNSFYRETPHPFVDAMIRMLDESQARLRQLPIQTRFKIKAQRQLEEDQEFTNNLVDKLIQERKAAGDAADNADLLGRMLTGVDKQTGEKLPDDNIRAQCITFLIAGHETTSGLLSFALYYLVKNPQVLARARAEVDKVFGSTAEPTYEQVGKLQYVRQILDETLRLWPTAPAFTRQPFQDTVIGGRYRIPQGQPVMILTPMLHRAKGIWGRDAEDFNPEHTEPERLASLPPHSYMPFGTGIRACIGRQFALQEATLVLGMLLQRFELIDYADYQLQTRMTLTVKPADFHLRVRRRPDVRLDMPAGAEQPEAAKAAAKPAPAVAPAHAHNTPLAVLFGSNLGTAESIAGRLAQEGIERGWDVTLAPLDERVRKLPAHGATIVISASYNGLPPDNALSFVDWVKSGGDDAKRVSYTVFGCGDTEWAATYQAVPKSIDAGLAAHGGNRVHPRGEGDARADFDAAYRSWHEGLWADLAGAFGLDATAAEPAATEPRLSISVVNRQLTNPVIMSYQAAPGMVRDNHELSGSPDGGAPARSVRHVEVALPEGMTHQTGDHLGVLPRNSIDQIRRVMRRFGLDAGSYLTIIPNRGSHTHLPLDEPAPLLGVLGSCVELQSPATRDNIEVMAAYTDDPAQRARLEGMVGSDSESARRFREEVLTPGRSVLDLLDRYPSCHLPFEIYLDMLPPLQPRYYSISSSSMVSPEIASITTGVLLAPARSGRGLFAGVCSNYIAGNADNSTVFVFVKRPTIDFRPPENPHVPMIMIGAGTGLAPFRGFLQERDALRRQGVPIGKSMLFFGCRHHDRDYLYEKELRQYEQDGVVEVDTVFSAEGTPDRKYVQHTFRERADEVWQMLQDGANIYVCGNANTIAPAIRAALIDLYREKTDASTTDAENWLADLRADGRYLEDVWGGNKLAAVGA